MRSFHLTKLREEWASILLIVLVTLITYAPFFGELGFYRDEWRRVRVGILIFSKIL